MRRLSARVRWAVPAGAVAVTGIVIAASAVASAEAAPSLPSRTPQQLLTEVAQGLAKPLGPLTATVQETANLGLPALPVPSGQGASPVLSSGAQSTSFWYLNPQHFRVAEQVPAGETDVRRDGRTVWVWNSQTQTATRYLLPAQASTAGPATGVNSVPGTPSGAAAQLLKAIGPTTVVSVQRNVYVAGQAAYQLSLVPRSSKSLVGSVLIAIDASRHIPLRVEVFARGSSTAAYSIGFTALSFGPPAASNFSFTPPPGATVKTVTVPGNLRSLPGVAGLGPLGLGGPLLHRLGIGLPHAALAGPLLRVVRNASGKLVAVRNANGKLVAVRNANGKLVILGPANARLGIGKVEPATLVPALSAAERSHIEAQFAKSLPASLPKAQRTAAIKAFDQHLVGRHLLGWHVISALGSNGGGFVNVGTTPAAVLPGTANSPHVIGTSWLSVVATPPNASVAAAVSQALSGGPAAAGQPSSTVIEGSSSSSSSSQAYGSTLTVSPPVGPDLAMLQALVQATVQVHGSWGSGRLLKTTLLTVLITSKGQILAGAVTPAVLYADVAADAG
jgi:outer membrane lipoprotein-sorting protein